VTQSACNHSSNLASMPHNVVDISFQLKLCKSSACKVNCGSDPEDVPGPECVSPEGPGLPGLRKLKLKST
jgi:hypothetical protein